ncbi:MAG: hypothetical protein ACTSO6_15125, partial [Promethearchaeota archaeon]
GNKDHRRLHAVLNISYQDKIVLQFLIFIFLLQREELVMPFLFITLIISAYCQWKIDTLSIFS